MTKKIEYVVVSYNRNHMASNPKEHVFGVEVHGIFSHHMQAYEHCQAVLKEKKKTYKKGVCRINPHQLHITNNKTKNIMIECHVLNTEGDG